MIPSGNFSRNYGLNHHFSWENSLWTIPPRHPIDGHAGHLPAPRPAPKRGLPGWISHEGRSCVCRYVYIQHRCMHAHAYADADADADVDGDVEIDR